MLIPKKANVVIIGGGIIGCSVAYHLGKLGWKDIVLLERKQLTCGTTWHAAGLIAQLRATKNMTRLAKYSQELYQKLEDETGLSTGFKRNGSITVALTNERMEELKRSAAMGRSFGVEIDEISSREILEKYPNLNIDDVVGGLWLPKDGQADPVNITQALAKGARNYGVQIIEGVKATNIDKNNNKVKGVMTSEGYIECDYIVNAGGMWAHEIGKKAGVAVPLHACEHFYIVTEKIKDLKLNLPVLRVPDESSYYKEDAGKILLGCFELKSKPWGMDGISEDFEFDTLADDFDHFQPILEKAIKRLGYLETAGIHTFFNGPESFTADDRYLLGEAPELKNFFVAAGFNSVGIQSAGGAGMVLADWMDKGNSQMDLWDVDIRRVQPFQNNRKYLRDRVTETLGLLYADHFPYRQVETSRNVRLSPIHNQLKKLGACFGETSGWERANWFLTEAEIKKGILPKYNYSWKRQNWFENSAEEHRAIREKVGLIDMSSFGKIKIVGKDAEDVLQMIAANDVAIEPGKIVYTQFLNETGCIESDVTITRLSLDEFLVVTPTDTVQRDLHWIRGHIPDNANAYAIDVTASEAVILIMGPDARNFLQPIIPQDLTNKNFPFSTMQEIDIGHTKARAHRVSYVGELGWELYISTDMSNHVFDELIKRSNDYSIKYCGLHAMDSCRIEKAYRHFGHDISNEDNVLEAGLGFVVKENKPSTKFGSMIGKNAIIKKKNEGLNKRLLQFRLRDPEPLLYHNEPILRDGEIVGYITSGNYGHHLKGAIGLGYITCREKEESSISILKSDYQIDVAGNIIDADASFKALYDPKSAKVKI